LRAGRFEWCYASGTRRFCHEIRVHPRSHRCVLFKDALDNPFASREDFWDITAAFLRHSMLEATLIAEGWSLSAFQVTPLGRSHRRRAPRPPSMPPIHQRTLFD
jgi:hypothetical protein